MLFRGHDGVPGVPIGISPVLPDFSRPHRSDTEFPLDGGRFPWAQGNAPVMPMKQ